MSRSFRAGLVVLGVLSTIDLVLPLLTDGEHPPMAVALVGSVLGIVSLALVVAAWRGASRAVIPIVVLRMLSALAALPAFFEPGVAAPAIAGAVTIMALTLIGVVLVLPAARRPARAGVR